MACTPPLHISYSTKAAEGVTDVAIIRTPRWPNNRIICQEINSWYISSAWRPITCSIASVPESTSRIGQGYSPAAHAMSRKNTDHVIIVLYRVKTMVVMLCHGAKYFLCIIRDVQTQKSAQRTPKTKIFAVHYSFVIRKAGLCQKCFLFLITILLFITISCLAERGSVCFAQVTYSF